MLALRLLDRVPTHNKINLFLLAIFGQYLANKLRKCPVYRPKNIAVTLCPSNNFNPVNIPVYRSPQEGVVKPCS